MKISKNQTGFTLTELLIVIVVIGILASIAIPKYMNYVKNTKQLEAKTRLRLIYKLEHAYRAEYDTFTTNLEALGYSANEKYYHCCI